MDFGAEPGTVLTTVATLLDADQYTIAREVLQRGFAILFLLAFACAWQQFPALLGERGLTPATDFIDRTTSARVPTLFRWKRFRYTDRRLRLVCTVGVLLALTVIVGLPQMGPAWTPIPVFLAMWWLYFSISAIGQRFYSFGWESLLLEAGFLVGFLGSHAVAPPLLMILFLRWLVIRVEFGAGMIKMRGDSSWRDLTAMDYHHQTQPMPGPLSRTAHLMPWWWHRGETLGSHIVQLAAPWLLLLPQPIASFAAIAIIITQLALVLTGNYAWLNWATILLAVSGISDSFLGWVIGGPWPGWGFAPSAEVASGAAAHWASVFVPSSPLGFPSSPWRWTVLIIAFVVWQCVLSRPALLNLFSPHQRMNASFNRWGLGNAYGAFGSMTQVRHEILIEGWVADDGWREYVIPGKPRDLTRRGPIVAPYHLRLAWWGSPQVVDT